MNAFYEHIFIFFIRISYYELLRPSMEQQILSGLSFVVMQH